MSISVHFIRSLHTDFLLTEEAKYLFAINFDFIELWMEVTIWTVSHLQNISNIISFLFSARLSLNATIRDQRFDFINIFSKNFAYNINKLIDDN